MRRLSLDHYLLFLVIALVIAAFSFSLNSPVARAVRKGELINALVIGTDSVGNSRHSDTLVFASYDPGRRFMNIVSIPRDTHFSPEGYRFKRVNEIYAYHYAAKRNDFLASREVKRAVEGLLEERVSIPYFLQIDYEGFRRFIDMIGGITVEVEEPMHYDDNKGDLHIHFEPGTYHMDGRQALEYVRFRGAAGDIGRVFRQQQFLRAILRKLKNPALVMRLPQIVNAVRRDIHTNLTFWDLIVGALELKDLDLRNLRLAQLPGEPSRGLWEVDRGNCAGLLERICPSSQTAVSPGPKVRVEVWNASGKNGLAEKVNWILRQKGFDVVEWGTYSVRQKKTLIKDLTGDIRSAQKIADVLRCGDVITRFDARQFAHISVILGEDCSVDQ